MIEKNPNTENIKYQFSDFLYDEKSRVHLLPDYKLRNFDYSDGAEAEKYISGVIKRAKDISDNSQELASLSRDWPSYYHLGLGRSNIMECLELPRGYKVLEIGSGCGALTRYLGEKFTSVDAVEGSFLRAEATKERCRDLKNVKVFCGNAKYINFNSVYDVATLIGVLEYAPLFLDGYDAEESCLRLICHVKAALKKEGMLVIAIENKIGLKYWNGFPEDHTGKVFDGIQDYPDRRSPVTFCRRGLEKILKAAGFSNVSFYYCFPDYKFASTIISDSGAENNFYLHNWIDAPFDSCGTSRVHNFHEGLAVKTLSEAGLIRELSNSFLVVASLNKPDSVGEPGWVIKKFSVKRRKEYQCVTTAKLNPGIHIEKKRLSGEAKDIIAEEAGLKLRHIVGDSPWCAGDLMIFDIFKALVSQNFLERILELLRIYYSEMMGRYHIGINDSEGFPLLRGDSIEFIFRNIVRKEGKLFCVDNEWVIEGNIPADYIMYRAISYDIIDLQKPWLEKKVKNPDKFTVELIKSFFPKYSRERNQKNILADERFQKIVVAEKGLNKIISNDKLEFFKKSMFGNLIVKIWAHLPQGLRIKIKSLLFRSL
ncbi:MAG: class I SAM-dependent methyltransferase [Candidatus Omnitrophota bacterium]